MGKRANGEGTVYQRKDGRWVATISLDNGQRTNGGQEPAQHLTRGPRA